MSVKRNGRTQLLKSLAVFLISFELLAAPMVRIPFAPARLPANASDDLEEVLDDTLSPADLASKLLDEQRDDSQFPSNFREIQEEILGNPALSEFIQETLDFRQKVTGEDAKSGLFKQLIDAQMESAKSNKPSEVIESARRNLLPSLLKNGMKIREAAQRYLSNTSLSTAARLGAGVAFIENVIFPFQAYTTLLWTFKDDPAEDPTKPLLLLIPDDLAPTGSIGQLMFEEGPNQEEKYGFILEPSDGTGFRKMISDPVEQFNRHIRYILGSPTPANWLRAMKWMALYMILSQIHLTKALRGDATPVSVPRECRGAIGIYLPSTLKFELPDPKTREERLDNLLKNSGFVQGTPEFMEYYLTYVSADPSKGFFNGILPLERLRNAETGMKNSEEVGIDDFTDFKSAQSFLLPKAMSEIEKGSLAMAKRAPIGQRAKIGSSYSKAWADEFGEMVMPAFEGFSLGEDDKKVSVYPDGLTPYLMNLMKKRKTPYWEDIVLKNVYKKLKATEVSIAFPPLKGSDSWRRWALIYLAKVLEANSETDDKSFLDAFESRIPTPAGKKEELKKIYSAVKEFASPFEYMPRFNFDKDPLKRLWPRLSVIWDRLQKQGHLPDSVMDEWSFLSRQIQSRNPWAALRLSYLTKIEELSRQSTATDESSRIKKQTFEKAAKVFALDVPLSPMHAMMTIKGEEKKSFFKTIYKEETSASSGLFTTKIDKTPTVSSKKWYENYIPWGVTSDDINIISPPKDTASTDFYNILEKINGLTLLDMDSFREGIREVGFTPEQQARLETEIAPYLEKEEGQAGALLYEIYKNRGDLVTQKKLFEKLKTQANWEGNDVREVFIENDTALKKPLFTSIVQTAALYRQSDLTEKLHQLCSMEPDNVENFRVLFYSTMETQNQINQMKGLPAIPEYLMKKVEEMTARWTNKEWWQMGVGLSGVPLIIAASLFAGSCVVSAGFTCLAVSSMYVGVTLTAAYTARIDADIKFANIEQTRLVKEFAEMGFSNEQASDDLSIGWHWMLMDIAFTFPMAGFMTRGVSMLGEAGSSLTSKAVKSSALRSVLSSKPFTALKGITTVAQKTAIGSAIHEALRSGFYSTNIKNAETLLELRRLWAWAGDVTPHTVTDVNKGFAKALSRFYGERPTRLLNLFEDLYESKILPSKVKMAVPSSSTSFIKKLAGKITLQSWRAGNLKKLAAQEAMYVQIIDELREAVNKGKTIEQFVMGNWTKGPKAGQPLVDDLADLIELIPFRKRELPYLALFQGGPVFNVRPPFMGKMVEGILTRRLGMARNYLLEETWRMEAKKLLGLPPSFARVGAGYPIISSFKTAVTNAAMNSPSETESKVIFKMLSDFEDTVTKKMLSWYDGQGLPLKSLSAKRAMKMTPVELKELLFAPSTMRERVLAEEIWSRVPEELLFNNKELSSVAHRALKELSNYSNSLDFNNFISALNVLWKEGRKDFIFET
jgi:hypothetical protein